MKALKRGFMGAVRLLVGLLYRPRAALREFFSGPLGLEESMKDKLIVDGETFEFPDGLGDTYIMRNGSQVTFEGDGADTYKSAFDPFKEQPGDEETWQAFLEWNRSEPCASVVFGREYHVAQIVLKIHRMRGGK